jgi:predicted NBD/HSP70 family sugar kinase
MAHHLGTGLAMLAAGLAPDVLVVVGEVTRAWGRVEPFVTKAVRRQLSPRSSIRIVAGNSELQPRLRGIIALVLQKHFAAPTIA